MNTRGDSEFDLGDDQFRDADISSLLNRVGGDAPSLAPAHQLVLVRVRTIRRRRTMAASVGAMVAIVAVGAVVVRGSSTSNNRDGIALDPRSSIVTTPDGAVVTNPDGSPVTVIGSPDTTIDGSTDNSSTDNSSTDDGSTTSAPSGETPGQTSTPLSPVIPIETNPGDNNPTEIPGTSTVPSTPSPTTTGAPKPSVPTTTAPSIPNTTPVTTAPTSPPPTTFPEREIAHTCAGGSVSVRLNGFGIFLRAIDPASGYVIQSQSRSTQEIRVVFQSGNGKSRVRWQLRLSRSGTTSCTKLSSDSGEEESESKSDDESSSSPTENADNNGDRADD